MNIVIEVREILALAMESPALAADRLDALADVMRRTAGELRAIESWKSPGGMGDRVLINVIGPDGTVKQTVERN